MQGQKQDQDYYKILGISNNANNEQIKRAYKKLAMIHHPDKNQINKQSALDNFRQIAQAYETLSDTQKKQSYDILSLNGLLSKYPPSNYMTAQTIYTNLYKDSDDMKDEQDNQYFNKYTQSYLNQLINKKVSNFKTNSKKQSENSQQKFSKIRKKQQQLNKKEENNFLDDDVFSKSVSTTTKTINGNTVTTKKITLIKKDGTKDIIEQTYENGRIDIKTNKLGVGESFVYKNLEDKC